MSMAHYSVYRLSDGAFIGMQLGIPTTATEKERAHALSTLPQGHAVKAGRFDHLSQRIDISADDHPVIDWQPPQPSPEHEWNATDRRWRLNEVALKKRGTIAKIQALEATQPRAVREAVLGQVGAADRLKALDDEIATLRLQLAR